jgi:hypothetical protein
MADSDSLSMAEKAENEPVWHGGDEEVNAETLS